MLRILLALLLFAALTAPADARMHAPYRGHRIVAAAAAVTLPPLDGLPAPRGAYSFRKLLSSYAGPGIRILRVSDSAEININFLGFVPGLGAPLDTAAAVAHCAATTCRLSKWYDQGGTAALDLVATGTAQGPLVFNCLGTQMCMETLNTPFVQMRTAGTITPATGVVSFSWVSSRLSGTGACVQQQNGNQNLMQYKNGSVGQLIRGGSVAGSVNNTAADNVWHATQGVIATTSSFMLTDGTLDTNAANPTGSVVAGQQSAVGAASVTACRMTEYVVWDGYALTQGEAAVIGASQKSYWGTP